MSQQIVDDLRQRLQLLQKDRRANVDLIETTKVNNAEEIGKLREENKELKSKLTKLHKTFTSSKHQGKNELSTLRKEVLKRRAEYDSLKVTSAKRKRELMKLGDEAKACELEAGTGISVLGPKGRWSLQGILGKRDDALRGGCIRCFYECRRCSRRSCPWRCCCCHGSGDDDSGGDVMMF